MAIVLVNTTFGGTSFSPSVTITIPSTSVGNLLIVMFGGYHGGVSTTSVADNAGNTYTACSGAMSGSVDDSFSDIWYCKNCLSGATSVTVTMSGSVNQLRGWVYEFSGADSATPFDTANSLQGSPGTRIGPVIVPSAAGELLVSIMFSGDILYGASSPWTGYVGSAGYASAYYINPPLSSQQCPFITPVSATFSSSAASFLVMPIPPLTLSLSDSISSSDTTVKEDEKTLTDSITSSDILALARAQNVSDSMTVTDSFTAQSDHIATVRVPTVEILVNQLCPAEVKTYFSIQE